MLNLTVVFVNAFPSLSKNLATYFVPLRKYNVVSFPKIVLLTVTVALAVDLSWSFVPLNTALTLYSLGTNPIPIEAIPFSSVILA